MISARSLDKAKLLRARGYGDRGGHIYLEANRENKVMITPTITSIVPFFTLNI